LTDAAKLVPVSEAAPRFPAVLRDIALVVEAGMSAEAVRALIREVGGTLLEEAALFDVYTGDRVPSGRKSLAFALEYRAADKTLTDAEVNQAHEKIVREVQARLGASLR
jgi:phenylalanyl-tRNA synthetase beta chain